ncbi:MAG TPA: erythromycin esterase family protein [Kofleriaceae bacterium]|nr:erythromycin esterase family protein [Kofleriaceae bacterium]
MVSRPAGEVPEAIRSIARGLHGEEDIDRLVELVAHKRIVMIGEATHGTHEFYDLRAALTRRLIQHHGFAAVAIEGDWPDALRVDRFVRDLATDDEDAESALDSFERFPRWMWRNADVAAFITWLRGHNSQRDERQRVGFYGLDLYSLHASMRAVIEYLEDNDHDAAVRARERYACFDHVQGNAEQYGLQAHLGIGPKCETEVVAQLVEMQLRKLARSGRSPSGDAWFHAVQQAHVVRNAEAYYRMMFAGRSASWNLRDTHMADTLDMLANHLGDGEPAKLIVWAHNSHVGDARATEMGDDGQLTLGQIARQRHPGDVALIGLTTHEGTVIAADDWEEPAQYMRVRPALPGSWEELLHEAGLSRFYLMSTDMKAVIGPRVERLQRAIGVVYRPSTERRSHYLHARLADELDVVIHLDTTHALEPLDPIEVPSVTPEQELPETYPTGV